MQGTCCHSAAEAPRFSACPAPETLRTRHETAPLSPPWSPEVQRPPPRDLADLLRGLRALVDSAGIREIEKRRMQDTGSVVPLHWIGFGYAALVATGGIIGYVKAGSVPSLAAGLLFGSLAGLGSYQLSQDPRNVWIFLATSGTLAGIMGMRFYHSGKFMPAGLIAGASLLMVAKVGVSMFNRPH
ncbi:Transmembrane protein 14C [Plecturocebus cupreus]